MSKPTVTRTLTAAPLLALILATPLAAEARSPYGTKLRAALTQKFKVNKKPGIKIQYRTTRAKKFAKGSRYSQRRTGTFRVRDGGWTIKKGTVDFLVTRSGKVRLLKKTVETFKRKPDEKAPAKVRTRRSNRSGAGSIYYNGVGRTGYHYAGGNPEAYARGLQAGLW